MNATHNLPSHMKIVPPNSDDDCNCSTGVIDDWRFLLNVRAVLDNDFILFLYRTIFHKSLTRMSRIAIKNGKIPCYRVVSPNFGLIYPELVEIIVLDDIQNMKTESLKRFSWNFFVENHSTLNKWWDDLHCILRWKQLTIGGLTMISRTCIPEWLNKITLLMEKNDFLAFYDEYLRFFAIHLNIVESSRFASSPF